MWEVWLIVAFAMAMVVGPVMMLQPTSGMSRLAKLRAIANKKGVNVRLPHREDGKKVDGAIYALPLTQKMRKNRIGGWELERLPRAHEIHFHGHWQWHGSTRAEVRISPILPQLLDGLPKGVTRLDCSNGGIGVLWDERTHGEPEEQAVDRIIQTLERVTHKIDSVL